MIGVLLLSHGKMAEGVSSAINLIAGEPDGFDYLGLEPGTTPEKFTEEIKKKIITLDRGNGVLLLCDIVGGTPFNTSCMIKRTNNVEILSGLNLGMALTAALERDTAISLEELADTVKEAGVESIRRFSIK